MEGVVVRSYFRIVLAGISAGSICWFEEGVTDSFGGGLEPIT
jgi:dipeptidase E